MFCDSNSGRRQITMYICSPSSLLANADLRINYNNIEVLYSPRIYQLGTQGAEYMFIQTFRIGYCRDEF